MIFVPSKLAAYGVDESFLFYIYTFLLNRKQLVQINNINRVFRNFVSGIPQGSIVGTILFNFSLMTFFYVIEIAMAHNFTDDNTLTGFAYSNQILIHLFKSLKLVWQLNGS